MPDLYWTPGDREMMTREHFEAISFHHWWTITAESVFGVDPRCLIAIPNGGHRHIGTARKLKAEGVVPGAPDYFAFVARQGYHGLAIELKAPVKTARLSDAQKAMKSILEGQGYVFRVCYGWDEARIAIEGYLGVKR